MIFTTIFMDSICASWEGLVSATRLYYSMGTLSRFCFLNLSQVLLERTSIIYQQLSRMLFVTCCGLCLRSSTYSWKSLRFFMCPERSFVPQRPARREGWRMATWCQTLCKDVLWIFSYGLYVNALNRRYRFRMISWTTTYQIFSLLPLSRARYVRFGMNPPLTKCTCILLKPFTHKAT